MLLGADRIDERASTLAGSEYLDLIHGLVAGRPEIDLDLEVRLQKACVELVGKGLITSAHDCSDGGLAIAIAECCIAGGMGFEGDFSNSARWDAALFGEAQSRIVVSVPQDKFDSVRAVCLALQVPQMTLGRTEGDSLRLEGLVDLPLRKIDDAWRNALERVVTASRA